MGKGFDYDFVHALLTLADSLRIGQLLEHSFGGIAGLQAKPGDAVQTKYTVAEIPVTRAIQSQLPRPDSVVFQTVYFDPPEKLNYMEGIATPLGLTDFSGSGFGYAIV
jgi:hypothetical protein